MSQSASPECPTPQKIRFLTRREAKDYRRRGRKKRTFAASKGMSAYLCGCGFWHLGHLSVVAKAIGRSEAYER